MLKILKNRLFDFRKGTATKPAVAPSATADESRNRFAEIVAPILLHRSLTFKQRLLLGAAILLGAFLLYRAVWLSGFYGPYQMLLSYFRERLPMAEPWILELLAGLGAIIVFAQAGTVLSYILFGKHKRVMLGLTLACIVCNAVVGWVGYGRAAVDENGKVRVRIVETPEGLLKVLDRDFDPETGRRAHYATENDLVMLDLQRRGLRVSPVGKQGPFRSPQGTIIVYYTRRDGQIRLYTGPRHPEVSGEMAKATDDILEEFKQQFGISHSTR